MTHLEVLQGRSPEGGKPYQREERNFARMAEELEARKEQYKQRIRISANEIQRDMYEIQAASVVGM